MKIYLCAYACTYVRACKPKVKQRLRAAGARVPIDCKCGCKGELEYEAGDVTGARSCQCVPCPVHRSQMEAATVSACCRRTGAPCLTLLPVQG